MSATMDGGSVGRAVVLRIRSQLQIAAGANVNTKSAAKGMAAYLKAGLQGDKGESVLGIQAPARRAVLAAVLAQPVSELDLQETGSGESSRALAISRLRSKSTSKLTSETLSVSSPNETVAAVLKRDVAGWETAIRGLWNSRVREEQYSGLDIANHPRFRHHMLDQCSMPLFEEIVRSCHWWDTLDPAATLVSRATLAQRQNSSLTPASRAQVHRQHDALFRQWTTDKSMWVRRAALLVHLQHRHDTDTVLLAETIDLLSHEEEFFIRKAIGWILRQYARFDARWVIQFCTQRRDALSLLSKREGLKHVGGLQAIEQPAVSSSAASSRGGEAAITSKIRSPRAKSATSIRNADSKRRKVAE